jgi:chemotaxis protein MotB
MNRIVFAVCAAALVAGCGVDQALYDARVNELSKAKADLDKANKDHADVLKAKDDEIAKLTSQNKELQGQLTALGAKSGADMAEMQKRIDEMMKAQAAAEARAKQYADLMSKFKSMIDSGKLKVEIRNGLMLVKLASDILFDPGKKDLKKEAKEALKEVSSILAGIAGRKFQVAGHTDDQKLGHGSRFKDNWELSTARAIEVVRFMISDGGMPAERVSAAGWADQLPVVANDSKEHQAQNRRIEIVLLPNIEDLPPMPDAGK